MKKFIFLFIFIIFLIPRPVFAHTTETDGDITLTIHFDPDDDPIVNEQTGFYFSFKDKTNQFKPTECNCTFTVSKNGTKIYSQPLFKDNTNPGLDNVSLLYTFPEKNVYQVTVNGEPLTANAFQSFTLTYAIRVERTSITQKANPQENSINRSWFASIGEHSIHVYIALALFAAFIIFAVIQKTKENNKSSMKGGDK